MQKMRVFSFIFLLAVMKMYSQEKVTYNDFYIEEKPQTLYEGIYKNGLPFNGYFKAEKFIDNIPFIDFYENGERKFRYYSDYFSDEIYFEKQHYNAKTEYENGKIKNGFHIKNQGKLMVFVEYQNFQKKKIHLDIFAMHYFNRITFELDNGRLVIKELQNPDWYLQMEKTKGNHINRAIYHHGKLFFQKETSAPQKVAPFTPNAITMYYKNNETNQLEIETIEDVKPSEVEMEKLQNLSEDSVILMRMFEVFDLKKEGTMETIFEEIHENILDENFSKYRNFGQLFSDKNSDLEKISFLTYDSNGKIEYGGKVTPNEDGTYRLEILGKEKKIYEKVSLDKIKELMKDGVVVG